MMRLDGVQNMALDRRLLLQAEAGKAGLRVYGWAGPWVSLGRLQSPSRALLPGCPVPWVRRSTGGRGVLHGSDITVAAAWPLAQWGERTGSRSVRALHALLMPGLVAAVGSQGHAVSLGAGPGGADAGDCFSAPASIDLIAPDGRKAAGCALRLTAGALLLQASIRTAPPLVDPAKVYASPADAGLLPGLEPEPLALALSEAWSAPVRPLA